jgi:nicotinamidase-related amidase
MDRLLPRASLLLVVDVQEKLAAAMPKDALDRLLAQSRILLEAAEHLGVPVVVSEQYPKGLGPTLPALTELLARRSIVPLPKLTFDAASDPGIASAIGRVSPRAVVLLGMESHVCVFQTAREHARRGHEVHVVADAVASRTEENRRAGLALSERAGAVVTVAETVVLDWLERAGTDAFRTVSRLVR